MLPETLKNSKTQITLKALVLVAIVCALAGRFFTAEQAYTAVSHPEALSEDSALQAKIDQYKTFKARHEDKDFRLIGTPVKRTEHGHGETRSYTFTIYHIAYGITEDNFREYNSYSKQIVRTPLESGLGSAADCPGGFFVEKRIASSIDPAPACLIDSKQSYPVALVLNTLSRAEKAQLVTIYEFEDGDIDIRFSFDKGSDKEFVQGVFKKLQTADERNDARRPETAMDPIIPTDNQRVSAVFLDENQDGEPEFVLLPYCINGSFFDRDPHNNAFQVGLKYRLVTRQDLAGKTKAEKTALVERLGTWMWDKPSEILASFTENPGPDIVFYDIGKVVDSVVIEERPDGKFDRFEFLY